MGDETAIPQAGDWVFFFPQGDHGAKPVPAMVTQDSDSQRALMLEVHYHGSISYANASKHMSAKATPLDRERNGGWSWGRVPPKQPAESLQSTVKK